MSLSSGISTAIFFRRINPVLEFQEVYVKLIASDHQEQGLLPKCVNKGILYPGLSDWLGAGMSNVPT